jgi:outer membrane protein insertion porin family
LVDQLTVFQEQRDDEVFLTDEAERLTRFLSDRGFRHASVHIRREVESDDRIVLHIVVDAGTRFRLEEVALEGNQAVSARELNALVATVPSSWFRTRYAKQDLLEIDRERIDALYRGRGFLTPQVAAEIAEDPARRTTRVTFRITEGPQTLIGAVRTEGNRAFTSETLLEHTNLQPGSPYIESAARTARAALLAFYNEHGYLYATVEATPRFSDDRTRVDLTLVIDEGLHVTIGTITLSGNQRTEDHVILRELQIKTGDAYNPRLVLESQRRVARLGFLSEVRLELVNPEQPESVKALRLSVKERDAGSVDLGVGYANFEGIRGFTEIAYRNLGGTGRRIALRVDGSRLERRTVLSYLEPWVFGRRVDGRAALLNEQRIEENKGYERTTYGVSLALEKELTPTLRASLGYDYQRHQFIGLDGLPLTDFLNLATSEDLRRANIGAVTPTVIRDTRDDPFNPSSGSTQTIAIRDAARILASENQFWKVTVTSGWYRALGRSLVGAVALRTGVANRFGETSALPLPERFYLGGRNTVRGYDEDTLGPTDPVKGTPTGGNAMIVGNIELRIRLPRALGLVFFVDGGNVWQEFHDVRLSEVRTTVGSGIRYNTPVGPLRLDYGHKLNWQPGEPHGTFHFTLGHAF